MSSSILARRVCLNGRFSSPKPAIHQQAWVSTSSAINRGLRATQNDREPRGGGKDRFERRPWRGDSFVKPSGQDRRRLSAHVDVQRDSSFGGHAERDPPNRDGWSATGPGRTRYSHNGQPSSFAPKSSSRRDAKSSERSDRPQRPTYGDDRSSKFSSAGPAYGNDRSSKFSSAKSGYGDDRSSKFSSGKPAYGNDRSSSKFSSGKPAYGNDRSSSKFSSEKLAYGDDRSSSKFSSARRDRPADDASNDLRATDRARRTDHSDDSSIFPKFSYSKDGSATSNTSGEGPAKRDGNSGDGLLKSIKNACRSVDLIQQREASGENAYDLIREVKTALTVVNSHITSGKFKEDEPAEAVVSLFRKKAKDGTFLAGEAPNGEKSVLYVTRDGSINLSVGKSRPGSNNYKDRRSPARAEQSPRTADRWSERKDVQLAPSRRSRDDHEDEDDGIPISVPFTTAASEFLYGYNSVLAALKGQRRKLYKLYIHPKIFDDEVGAEGTQSGDRPASELADLADYANVPIRNQVKNFMLDKMSGGRPHNGVVLEASKLPSLPVLSLQKPEARKGIIPITLAEQSAEEAKVNGTPRTIPALSGSWRYPLVVLLDGITDPGNVGNIIRTCHFYGVDAVAIATNTCANLSSGVLAKASAGACEAMSILSLPQPSNFVRESAQYRWKVYAAVAPISNMGSNARFTTTASIAADSPLAQHPCILMLGAEGAGLRENLKSRADKWVAISGGARADHVPDVGVDSMNVGSAAGVLLESFLRKPASAPDKVESEDLGF